MHGGPSPLFVLSEDKVRKSLISQDSLVRWVGLDNDPNFERLDKPSYASVTFIRILTFGTLRSKKCR